MATVRLIRHRIIRGVTLLLVALSGYPILAQTVAPAAPATSAPTAATGPTGATNAAPDPRDAEAQRRLVLSHRRREAQIEQDAQAEQLLTASQEVPAAVVPHQRHRATARHRALTAEGRRAVRPATQPGVAP
jgi:hypothetical protein